MRQLTLSDATGDTKREHPIITGNHTSFASRDSPGTMKAGSIGNRATFGDYEEDATSHIRDDTDTAGTSSSTHHRPARVQLTIDNFFNQQPSTNRDRGASTRLRDGSLDIQDGRQGVDLLLPDVHDGGDSAGDPAVQPASDVEPPSAERPGIARVSSDDDGSHYSLEEDEALHDGLSEWWTVEASDPEGSGWDEELDWDEGEEDSPGARNDGAAELKEPGLSTDDVAGHRPHTDTDIYSSASGMKMVVVNCFEELFTPERYALEEAREAQDAIDTGMDSQWPFLEAARAHRALKCMHIEPGTVLYGRLFMRLASALVKAFTVRGTLEQQKVVFLMEATSSFEVEVKKNITRYYFDTLSLVPQLFHADLLVTRLFYKHEAHLRWLRAPKPGSAEGHATTHPRQWALDGEPQISGGGVTDRSRGYRKRKGKITATNKAKIRPRRRTMIDARGVARPIKDTSSLQISDSTSGSDSSQNRRRNATETHETPSSREGGSWTRNDINAMYEAVRTNRAKNGKIEWDIIFEGIKAGVIPMDKKDRSQQTLRSYMLSVKTRFLKYDQKLPPGFDHIIMDKTNVAHVTKVHKNPWRKEADLDSNGQPTNTEFDPAQDPKLKQAGTQGHRRMIVSETVTPGRRGRNVQYKPRN